jgi:MFS family permease
MEGPKVSPCTEPVGYHTRLLCCYIVAISTITSGMMQMLVYPVAELAKESFDAYFPGSDYRKMGYPTLVSMLSLGGVFIALFTFYCKMNNVLFKGRLLIGNTISFYTLLMGLLGTNYWNVLVTSFFIGLHNGYICIHSQKYISSMAPKQNRGALLSIYALGSHAGIVMGLFFSKWSSKETWRRSFYINLAIVTAQAVLVFFLLEEPVEEPRQDALKSAPIDCKTCRNRKARHAFIELLGIRKARTSLFVFLFLHFLAKFGGIYFLLYAIKRVLSTGSYALSVDSVVTLLHCAGFLTNVTFSPMVERLGRTRMLTASSIVCAFGFLALGLTAWKATCTLVCLMGFNLGLGALPWVTTFEIFPREFHQAVGTFGTFWAISCAALAKFISISLYEYIGFRVAYLFIALYLCNIFVATCVLKNMSNDEAPDFLSGEIRFNKKIFMLP